jgi:rod shape-determining protein MreC
MDRVTALIFSLRDYVVLLISVFVSLILVATSEGPAVDALRGAMLDQWGSITARFVWVSQLSGALDENQILRSRNLDLAMQNARLRELTAENNRLRSLLDFRETQPSEFVAANVTGLGRQRFTNALMIDVGEQHGVQKHMIVMTDEGLVGRVMTAGESQSLVQLMTDVNFGVSARIQRNRTLGVVEWHGGQYCTLSFVPKSADVAPGDTVVTSGHGEFAPPHIPVGIVSDISDAEPGLFKIINVNPIVDATKVEEVFIMISTPEQEFNLE